MDTAFRQKSVTCAQSRKQIKMPNDFNRPIRSVLGSNIERKSDIGRALRSFHSSHCTLLLTRKCTNAKCSRQPQTIDESPQSGQEGPKAADISSYGQNRTRTRQPCSVKRHALAISAVVDLCSETRSLTATNPTSRSIPSTSQEKMFPPQE